MSFSNRWVSFDCFGTLVDWHAWFAEVLGPLGSHTSTDVIRAYHAHERLVERDYPHRSYKDVLVTARPETDTDRRSRRSDPDATGLRRIPQSAGFRITEESNRVKVSADSPNRSVTFEIEAPARTNLKLSTVNGGEILVENVEGELTVSNTNGGITLNGVAGSVMAGTTNGNVRATLTRVTAQKEMAFTSLNGTVDVTLPPTTKANLRLRSNNGDVYSDFDVQLASSAPVVQETRSSNGRYRISRNQSIVGAINGGGPEFELRTFNSNVYVRKGR